MLRLASINLQHIDESIVCANVRMGTNLFLVNIVSNMVFVLCLRNIGPPTRHEFDIFDMPLLPFELEVAIDGKEESI